MSTIIIINPLNAFLFRYFHSSTHTNTFFLFPKQSIIDIIVHCSFVLSFYSPCTLFFLPFSSNYTHFGLIWFSRSLVQKTRRHCWSSKNERDLSLSVALYHCVVWCAAQHCVAKHIASQKTIMWWKWESEGTGAEPRPPKASSSLLIYTAHFRAAAAAVKAVLHKFSGLEREWDFLSLSSAGFCWSAVDWLRRSRRQSPKSLVGCWCTSGGVIQSEFEAVCCVPLTDFAIDWLTVRLQHCTFSHSIPFLHTVYMHTLNHPAHATFSSH